MRILIVCPDAPPNPNGGLGTYLEGILAPMEELNVSICLVGTSRDVAQPRISSHGSVTIHRLYAPRPWSERGPLIRSCGLVHEYLRLNVKAIVHTFRSRTTPDLVVVHDWMCAPAGLAASVFRRKVVFHVHSSEVFLGEARKGPVSFLGRMLTSALSRVASAVIVPTMGVIKSSPPLRNRRSVKVIHHGAGHADQMLAHQKDAHSAETYSIRKVQRVPSDHAMLLYAGRLAPQKGVFEMLTAVAILIEQDIKMVMVIAGKGIPDVTMDAKLLARAERLGITSNLRWLGRFLSTEELADYYVAADACVFPSTHEGYGFVALEAMSLGARTVVGCGYDSGIVGVERHACIQASSSSPEDLAEAIKKALDESYEPAMDAIASTYVNSNFSWSHAAKETLAYYKDVISS